MTECVVEVWNYWMVAGLVAATAGIVFIATWTYMQDRFQDLLREVAAERASRHVELVNARIINDTFGRMRAQSIANWENHDG